MTKGTKKCLLYAVAQRPLQKTVEEPKNTEEMRTT